jgi:hypothetical protein
VRRVRPAQQRLTAVELVARCEGLEGAERDAVLEAAGCDVADLLSARVAIKRQKPEGWAPFGERHE